MHHWSCAQSHCQRIIGGVEAQRLEVGLAVGGFKSSSDLLAQRDQILPGLHED